jgi:myosin heavy subunit
MYALQAAQTDARVESLQPESIEYKPPRRGVTLAAGLLLVAVPLSLRGPSAERLSEQKLAEETAAATAVVNKELESLVEELRKEASDDEENSLLDPDKLRRWVDELKETADPKEALRQYATLERKLNEARLSLRNQRDQQLLERAAREMETSRETQALAEQLRQKDYDRSSKTLEKMGPSGGEQPLTRQRRDLARLKAAAQHMAAAARSARSSASGSQTGSSGSEGSGQSGSGGSQSSGGGGSGEGGGSDMAKTMEDLDAAVEDFDDALKEAERQESQLGQCDAKQRSECESCQTDVDDQVKRLCKQLCKLGVCQRAEKRLCKLCKACSQCQSGLCNSSCSGLTPGGKQAGTGSNTARRDAREELADNGQTTQLKGQKGQGPSQTTVEAAEDGSGVGGGGGAPAGPRG